ncbi:hypothetical protein JCM3765_002874 [Sporobolomyces pararoseus]
MVGRHERIQRFEFLLQREIGSSPSSIPGTPSSEPEAQSSNDSEVFESQWRAEELRRVAQEGIPDDPPHIRPATYRQLLNLSSPASLSSEYATFLAEIRRRIASSPLPSLDEPLNQSDKLLREIERDVERTFGALAWFGKSPSLDQEGERQQEGEVLWERIRLLDDLDRQVAGRLSKTARPPKSAPPQDSDSQRSPAATTPLPTLTLNIPSSVDTTSVDIPASPHTPTASTIRSQTPPSQALLPPSSRRPSTRRDRLLQPLYVYAFLNPGVSYVQGMSYIAAVFFFIFASDPELSPDQVEASTFFAFATFVSQLQDLYVPTLDQAVGGHGLGATMERFEGLLLWLDPALADTLERKRIDLRGVILRWITTVFANEFSLPDLVRLWDRIISFYPQNDQQVETLSPVLSHVLDLALAILVTKRATVLSPYSNHSKIYTSLQSPSIEGAAVDELLFSAWEIRERRLGHPTPKLSNPAPVKRLGAATTTDSRRPRSPPVRNIDERGGGTFGSLSLSSPHPSSGSFANNVSMIKGKLLPPPPARIEGQGTISSAVNAKSSSPEYGIEDNDGKEERTGGASSLGGWFKKSVSRIAASDAAATLSKRATNLQLAAAQSASATASRFQSSDAAAQLLKAQTNLSIQAQLFKDRVATVGSERATLNDFEPRETPFTPPVGSRTIGPSSPSNSPGGSAPRPLLLSSSARKANNNSIDETSDSTVSSRRNSTATPTRSPSVSPLLDRSAHLPLLSPDLTIPPLSRSPSRGSHGRSISTFDTPTRPVPAANVRSRSSSQSSPSSRQPHHNEEIPNITSRLGYDSRGHRSASRDSIENGGDRGSSISEVVSLRGEEEGSDSTETSFTQLENDSAEQDLTGLAIQLPSDPATRSSVIRSPSALPPRHSSQSLASRTSHASNIPAHRSSESTFATPSLPSETPFIPPSSAQSYSPPSSTAKQPNISSDTSASSSSPPAQTSSAQPSLSRGAKVVRRPAASKKRPSRGSSMTNSVDLGANSSTNIEERRIASEFSSRSTSRHSDEIYRGSQGVEEVDRAREDTSRDSLYGESSLLNSYHQ